MHHISDPFVCKLCISGLLQSVTKTDIIKYKIRDSELILRAFREQSAKVSMSEGLYVLATYEVPIIRNHLDSKWKKPVAY